MDLWYLIETRVQFVKQIDLWCTVHRDTSHSVFTSRSYSESFNLHISSTTLRQHSKNQLIILIQCWLDSTDMSAKRKEPGNTSTAGPSKRAKGKAKALGDPWCSDSDEEEHPQIPPRTSATKGGRAFVQQGRTWPPSSTVISNYKALGSRGVSLRWGRAQRKQRAIWVSTRRESYERFILLCWFLIHDMIWNARFCFE